MSQQKQSRGRGGTRQRDGLWGTEVLLMSWVVLANGGGWFVWPHSTCSEEKQAKTPTLDKGCYGNPSPLGHEISGESTDRMCLQRVCGNRKNVMSSLLFKAKWVHITSSWGFLFSFWATYEYIQSSLLVQFTSISTCACAHPACL